MPAYIDDLEEPCDDCGADEGEPCDPECEHYDEELHGGYTREIEAPSQYEEPVPPGW
ncbi:MULTISPECIES: hypothetical protein [Streptomyces]|jgi:hypothetical protein|uniref:hypothetical protein n=1 Tax=Streptomyces TaxID=1883 RepID=UPI002F917747|nr:hypothetical protein OG306_40185 [Streptomyces sp. NBC_01241]